MSRLHKDSTVPSVASTSQEGQENRTLKVTFLSSEWKSSTDGDLSTINRELAIQLAKYFNVDVSVLLPKCSEEDKSSAESHHVKLIEADRVPGLKPVFCLSSPPRNHIMDCVIGHGVHLGQQIALIKGNPHYCHCKWIQVVHSAPEEDGMYKNISEGEQMQQTEIELCKMADQVVTIGPKLADIYRRYLCRGKQQQNVFDLTPSIFSEFLEVEQATEERRTFCVLVIGSGDSHEDFNVKGFDIAAKAIAELKDESYKLRFICPPGGKGDEMAEKLLRHGISRNQLIVRSFNDSREVLANLFCEVDLAIMPSRTEGFGITALEALSAGLPILVSGNSGLGEALKEVPLASHCMVDSDDSKDWAREIKNVCQKKREVRLKGARFLRANYLEKYSWEGPCRSLVERMYKLTFAAEGLSSGHSPQSTMECVRSLHPTVTVSQNKLVDQRSYTQSQNRRPPSGHGQNPYAGASSTDYGGFVHQECHPHGFSSYGLRAPVAVDYSQGNHPAAFVNPNNQGSQTFPQSQNRYLSFEHGQNLYAGASSTHYRGPVHQGCHPQAVDSSQGNLPTAFANLSNQGSQTFPRIQNRHPSTEHGHYPFVGASSIYNRGVVHQGYQPQGSFSYGLPAPVAVNYNQGNLPVPLVNTSHQGSQTFPQSSFPYGVPHLSVGHSQCLSPSAVTRNEDPIHWGSHTQSFNSYGLPATSTVDYRNPPATFVNPNYQESQTFPWGFVRHDQFPLLVNQSQSSPQVFTWTQQDPSYHSNRARAQQHIKKVVSKLMPSQRSSLNRQFQAIPRAGVTTVNRSDSVFTRESQTNMDPPSSTSSNRDSAIGSLPSAMSDDELLQAIVDNFERPQSLCLSPSCTFSPSEEVDLNWSRSLEDSPRMPPVKLAVGKKCQEIIEQEEAEAIAKAMAVSSLDSGPSRIPSLDSGDEMVIIFTQPESLEKAVNSKHLYLEGVHWKKGELLGTGAYSSCYAVRDLMSGSLMAVKQVSFCRNSVEEQTKVTQTIEDEISLLGRLQHPHLIKCLGATKHAGHFNIFLEWMAGGSITNLLKKYGPFDEGIVISYTMQIFQGLGYLHQNQVVHRDIKGANILVDSTGKNIRIADFGAAARLATQLTGAGEFQGQMLGTFAFMAPEVLRGESYGRSCDVWSVGCVIIEMVTGKPPWNAHEHSNHLAVVFKIAMAESPPDIPDYLNPALRDVLLRCFELKQGDRPPATELLRHPLFTQM